MLIGLMKGLAILYYWTWFIWPFVFVFSLVSAIRTAIKKEQEEPLPIMAAEFSLLLMIAAIVAPGFN